MSTQRYNWFEQTTPIRPGEPNPGWSAIKWIPELQIFVCVGENTNQVMISPDGYNWSLQNSPLGKWVKIAWSPSLLLIVAIARLTTGNAVMTSPNGINWTIRSTPADITSLGAIDWSPGLGIFVALTTGDDRGMYSVDGINWVSFPLPAASGVRDVVWSPELNIFVAICGGAAFPLLSSDGINWTKYPVVNPDIFYKIIWAKELGLFVAGSHTSPINHSIITSVDGINWIQETTPSYVTGLTWSAEARSIATIGIDSGIHDVTLSPDGINYLPQNNSIHNNWIDITYSPLKGIFVGIASSLPYADINKLAIVGAVGSANENKNYISNVWGLIPEIGKFLN